MKKIMRYKFSIVVLIGLISFVNLNCKNHENKLIVSGKNATSVYDITPIDSTAISPFFKKYPKLKAYQNELVAIYKKQQFHYIWFDKNGIRETADVLNDQINSIDKEGIQTIVPYKDVFEDLFQNRKEQPDLQLELFLTAYYFYYTTKVNQGIDELKSKELGWYLPRKRQSYVNYLDSILSNPKKLNEEKQMIGQYYKLKEVLKNYREIEKKGSWTTIETASDFKSFHPGDSAQAIGQIRTRLFLTGDVSTDSKSAVYDESLKEGLLNYKKRNGFAQDNIVLPKHIADMNVPISARIKSIIINMERCRWISPDLIKSKEWIVINIPSYKLTYFKNEKVVLTSNVVVGTELHKTVIFSGMMQYIVFSPYWNVPTSILKKEILPGIKRNKRYLRNHNMEWHNGAVRQKPGLDNSLGLVKFLFPNSNNIYLHDSPAKNLFTAETRAFSHGCIRVAKPKELANAILENDPNWTPEKIEEAMNKGKESWYTLKSKIPVYIGYFTTWVDREGHLNFYKDVYNRDSKLEALLVED
jgi:L,D-transpeptidase YcbB